MTETTVRSRIGRYTRSMVTEVRQSVRVQSGGRLEVSVPHLRAGTVAEVIIRVQDEPPELTIPEKLAALKQLRESLALTDEQAEKWMQDVKAERLAWRIPGDVE